ncbi:helix-turn-helix domain-containing protein [Streptomyces sp. NPDC019937]|uniref:PucR family transcriptional regulator n=1 Tax=Streptomyces sp. NPDC019937 TaxID=3154787 RepID=UPI0033D863E4
MNGGLARIHDVVIVDSACPPAAGQVILAVGVQLETSSGRELIAEAERAGAAAVVFRAAGAVGVVPSGTRTSVLLADAHIGWAQLLLLLRTLASAAQDETSTDSPDQPTPSSMHGLADAIATMVGGSVVLYDRAHRVIAYAVQGHEIDNVRRDAILGKRTPERWIKRFTIDKSAYQTFRNVGEVVRVDSYEEMRPRLRIAIHAGGEILGEISVAEGRQPLTADAEEALKRAAGLVAPFMLRHRVAEDTGRTAREQMLRGLLEGNPTLEAQTISSGLDPSRGLTVVGFALHAEDRTDATSAEVFAERLVHLLSLQVHSLDPAAGVVSVDGAYYALIPTLSQAAHELLVSRLRPALAQLQRLDIEACAAIGRRATGLREVPVSRSDVDDQLLVLGRRESSGVIGTKQALWADMTLLPAERAVAAGDPELTEHLCRLAAHDARHGTEFVKTLNTYLEVFGSTSAAAEQLVLHPNTLRHRLGRLAEISGVDLEDPSQRLALALQLRARALPDCSQP